MTDADTSMQLHRQRNCEMEIHTAGTRMSRTYCVASGDDLNGHIPSASTHPCQRCFQLLARCSMCWMLAAADSGGFKGGGSGGPRPPLKCLPPTPPKWSWRYLVWTGHFAKNWYMVDTVVCRMKWTFSGWAPISMCGHPTGPPTHKC